MELDEAIRHAIDGNCVLFLGSGFSYKAENLVKDSPLNGRDFADHLFSLCGVNAKDGNLALASQVYIQKFGAAKLAELCRETFSIRRSAPHHEQIIKLPWQRIYTTNYDDLVEKSASENGKLIVPLTLEDAPEKYLSASRVCLHINGFINKLSVADLSGGFKLTAGSYLNDALTGSNWGAVLRQDLRLARSVIFVGYSMYDLDIQRIFHAEDIKEKTFFVTSPKPSDTDAIMLPIFGKVCPLGVEDFAAEIVHQSENHKIAKSVEGYMALEKISAPRLRKQPTNADIERLFLYGVVEHELIDTLNVSPEPSSRRYLVDRVSSLKVEESLRQGLDVVFTSDLGNGKTVVLEQVAYDLASKGWDVYRFTSDSKTARAEANRLLASSDNTVLIIDNYIPFLDFIDFVSVRRTGKKFRFILSSRSHVNEVYRDRLENALRTGRFAEHDLNKLAPSEVTQLVGLIDSYGLWAEFSAASDVDKLNLVRSACEGQVHQVLLKLYSSPQISNRIVEQFSRLPAHLRRVAIAVFILKGSGLSSDRRILNELLKDAPLISISNTDRESVRFLWSDASGHLKLKSSVLGEYYLTNLAEAQEVVDILLEMFLQAHSMRGFSREYEYFLRSIMSFSALQKLLPKVGLRSATIKFYESIQNLDFTKRNPHYWLQYAIARLSFEDDLDEIAPYFQSSYALAKTINYDTFQIDNHYARFLLAKAARENSYDVAYSLYLEAKALLMKQMLREQKHYPYRVAASVFDFVKIHSASITVSNKKEILGFVSEVLNRIEGLPTEVRRHKHVTTCQKSLSGVKQELEVLV